MPVQKSLKTYWRHHVLWYSLPVFRMSVCWWSFTGVSVLPLISNSIIFFSKSFRCYDTPYEFFTPVFADGLSLEFQWQQVTSGLQDSSHYWSRSKKMLYFEWSWFVLRFPTLPFPFPHFWRTILSTSVMIGITVTFMFHSFLSYLARSKYLPLF